MVLDSSCGLMFTVDTIKPNDNVKKKRGGGGGGGGGIGMINKHTQRMYVLIW